MGYTVCDAEEVEAVNGVFRPIRRALGVRAFGINQEEWPAHADQYPDHDHAEDGQEEVYCILEGSGRMTVDGQDVELMPGRFVLVSPNAKRKVHPGEDGLKMIIVGSPIDEPYKPRSG
jgi:quercetin dioxygenase-like cupin family protein